MRTNNDRTYTVTKTDLLAQMQANRSRHREIFEEAITAFRAEAIRQLDESLKRAKAGKNIRLNFGLAQPEDHTKDYDRVIGLFEMTLGEVVEITEEQYQLYVMDDWHWRHQFEAVANSYTGKQY